jgi:hypothetical protein
MDGPWQIEKERTAEKRLVTPYSPCQHHGPFAGLIPVAHPMPGRFMLRGRELVVRIRYIGERRSH